MTTAYSRIDRFLRQNLNDKDYPAYKEELDALCQAKLQRTWVGLPEDELERLIHNFGNDPHTLLDEVDARLRSRNT